MLTDERARKGVGGDLVGGDDDRVQHPRVVDVASLRTVSHEHAHRVDDDERRAHEGREVGDGDVDVLVQAVAPAADDAVPVLHSAGEPGQVVVLGHRHVDDLVRVDQGREDRPLVEDLAVHPHGSVAVLGRQNDLGAQRVRLAPDSGALVAAIGVVAGAVRDDDLLRSRVEGLLDDGAHDVGVGVCRVDRQAVPADVGFHHDDVAVADEALHAADSVEGLADQIGGEPGDVDRPTPGDREVGEGTRGAGAIEDAIVAHLSDLVPCSDGDARRVPGCASER